LSTDRTEKMKRDCPGHGDAPLQGHFITVIKGGRRNVQKEGEGLAGAFWKKDVETKMSTPCKNDKTVHSGGVEGRKLTENLRLRDRRVCEIGRECESNQIGGETTTGTARMRRGKQADSETFGIEGDRTRGISPGFALINQTESEKKKAY